MKSLFIPLYDKKCKYLSGFLWLQSRKIQVNSIRPVKRLYEDDFVLFYTDNAD